MLTAARNLLFGWSALGARLRGYGRGMNPNVEKHEHVVVSTHTHIREDNSASKPTPPFLGSFELPKE